MIRSEDVEEEAELMMELMYVKNKVAEANLTRGSIRRRRLGSASSSAEATSILGPATAMPLFAPNCIVPDYFPLCRITVYCARCLYFCRPPNPCIVVYRGARGQRQQS